MQSFRVPRSDSELVKYLKKMIKEEENTLIVWQSSKAGRVKSIGHLNSIHESRNKIIMSIRIDESSLFNFKEGLFICDHDQDSLLLQAKVKSKKGSNVELVISDKNFIKELRQYPRTELAHLNLKSMVDIFAVHSNKTKEEQVNLNNLSTNGMSFKIPNSRGTKYQKGDTLVLKTINKFIFSNPIQGHIIHISSSEDIGTLGNSYLIVGVFFSQPLDNFEVVISSLEFMV